MSEADMGGPFGTRGRIVPRARPNDAQVMAAHVAVAVAALNDGAVVSATLEHLWRTAYASGVRRGAAAKTESLARHPATGRYGDRDIAADARKQGLSGWQYGPAALLGVLNQGTHFRYGGMDSARPSCDREVVTTSTKGEPRMFFSGTGEHLRFPASAFWVNLGLPDA